MCSLAILYVLSLSFYLTTNKTNNTLVQLCKMAPLPPLWLSKHIVVVYFTVYVHILNQVMNIIIFFKNATKFQKITKPVL